MILSLPLALLNVLLLQSNSNSFVQGFTSTRSAQQTKASFTVLNARPNPNPILVDPYASLINKVAPPDDVSSSISAAVPTAPSTSSLESISNQVNDLVDKVNQAANIAIEASNQANTIGSTIFETASSPIITESVTNAASTVTQSTTVDTTSLKTPFSSAAASSPESFEKAPTLFQYFAKGDAVTDLQKVSKSVASTTVPSVEKVVNDSSSVAKSMLGSTSKGLTDITTNAKSFAASVGAAASSTTAAVTSSTSSTSSDGVSMSMNMENLPSIQDLIDNLRFDLYGAWYLAGASFLYALSAKNMGRDEAMAQFEAELNEAKARALEAAEAAGIAAEGAKMAKELVDNIDKSAKSNPSSTLLENSRLEEMKTENDLMRMKIKMLEATNAEQEMIIAELRQKSIQVVKAVKSAKTPVVKEIVEPDPEEDARFIQILKDMDEENAKNKVKSVKAVSAKAPATKAKKATSKKTKKVVEKVEPVPEKVEPVAEKESKAKVTKSPKKSPKVKVTIETKNEGNPWGALKPSTLQRKTISQLTEYLQERKVETSGLTKKELVGTIQSL